MSGFYANGENFDRIFITDYQILDQYIGTRLFSMGAGGKGQLGDFTTVGKSLPVQTLSAGNNWAKIAAGSNPVAGSSHMAAIKTDGTLWTWGSNLKGQLGQLTATTASRSSPTTVDATTSWREVACGQEFVIAVKTDGTLWSWGANSAGVLGLNVATNVSRSSPVTVSTATTWRRVAAGGGFLGATSKALAAAIKADGSLWTWGSGTYGALGTNAVADRSVPTLVSDPLGEIYNWTKVAVGQSHMVAIRTDGSAWAWGSGTSGQLGNLTTVGRSSPISIAGGSTIAWKEVAAGSNYSAGVKVDGSLWTWGQNASVQLGTGEATTASRSSPITVFGGGTTWKTVACGYSHTAAVKTDGTLWTWGANAAGQLGDGTLVNKSTPILVTTMSGGWKSVAASGDTTADSGNTLATILFTG